MRQVRVVTLLSLSVIAALLAQGCATRSGSGTGQSQRAQEERINDPAIKEVPSDDGQLTDSRTSPAMRSELMSRNATGLAPGTLVDVLFDFDRDTLRLDAMRVLEADAKRLQHDRVARLILEGRGDEFGTLSTWHVFLNRSVKVLSATKAQWFEDCLMLKPMRNRSTGTVRA